MTICEFILSVLAGFAVCIVIGITILNGLELLEDFISRKKNGTHK